MRTPLLSKSKCHYAAKNCCVRTVALKQVSLFALSNYSHLTITCGPDTHKFHKNIVCTRCGFFERAERFAVGKVSILDTDCYQYHGTYSSVQEAAENKIDLPEDEPATIRLLLEYLYTSEYTPQLREVTARNRGGNGSSSAPLLATNFAAHLPPFVHDQYLRASYVWP